jgi:hypothetical protein
MQISTSVGVFQAMSILLLVAFNQLHHPEPREQTGYRPHPSTGRLHGLSGLRGHPTQKGVR